VLENHKKLLKILAFVTSKVNPKAPTQKDDPSKNSINLHATKTPA
jgi:hypothetical protein